MTDDPIKEAAQKTKHRPGEKVEGQEAVQSQLWEFMLNGRTGRPVDAFRPSSLFICAEKE